MRKAVDPVIGCRALGAFRALHSFRDVFVLLHGLMGCHSGFLTLRLLQDNADARVMITGMQQDDVVYGGVDRVRKAIVQVHRRVGPSAIAVVECCASALIGDDIESAITYARTQGVDTPIIHISGGGFHSDAKKGFEEALLKAYDEIAGQTSLDSTVGRSGKTLCMIGLKLDEYRAEQDMSEISRILGSMGINVLFAPGSSVKALSRLQACDLLAVMGGDGIELARRVEKDLGIPYITVPYPFGFSATQDMLHAVAGELGVPSSVVDRVVEQELEKVRNVVEKSWIYLKTLMYSEALVIGSPGRAIGLATMLSRDLGMPVQSVLTYYPTPLSTPLPLEIIEDRSQILEHVDENTDVVFGSSFDVVSLRSKSIPVIEYDYPVLYRLSLTDSPLAGFRGIATWLEEIVLSLKVAKIWD